MCRRSRDCAVLPRYSDHSGLQRLRGDSTNALVERSTSHLRTCVLRFVVNDDSRIHSEGIYPAGFQRAPPATFSGCSRTRRTRDAHCRKSLPIKLPINVGPWGTRKNGERSSISELTALHGLPDSNLLTDNLSLLSRPFPATVSQSLLTASRPFPEQSVFRPVRCATF